MACKLSELTDRSDQSYMDDKRGASQDEFVLERVQGLTSTSLHSLASNSINGWVAFPAACVLVVLDPKTNEQKFIESPSLRNISCCAFSDDGRFVAFAETGMKPHIAMWNLREHKECHKFIVDNSVRAMFFHPMSAIIVSLGLKENLIAVWDYVKGTRLATCKWQTLPLSLTIPRTGSKLVVCGHRKITLFNIAKVHSHSYETNVFEDRKTVLLGKQSEYTFVDVESGRGKYEKIVYTVTSCGYLCEIKLGDILIDKALKVDTQTFCVRYSTELLFVGCTAGVVKICDPDNLTVTAAVSLSSLLGPSAMPKVGNKGFLDVCTLVVDENDKIVTCVYADCSMHSWQIGTDGEKIVCSAIEPFMGANDSSGQQATKSNLLRSFIGCCEKTKTCNEILSKSSLIEHNKLPQQYGGRCLVNENRASYQNVNAVRFTPDGKDVICGNTEGEIKVYELSTGILRRVIEAHSSQVTCIELMYDEHFQLVCSGGRDRVMFVLDARKDFSLVQVLCDHSAAIIAISLVNHKGVLTLVSAAADNVILIRRAILGGTLRFTITGEIAQTNCSRSFFVTSDFIALGGKDSQIKVFKADPVFQSKPIQTINCQKLSPSNAGFKAIDIDPSGSFMAVSQCNGNISVYHLQTGQPVASLPLQSDITKIHFTSDLKYMISSTSNGCDLVWRLPERMTEFMQSKQDKTYHIETSKEITSEAFMSCVKVCKEEVDETEYTVDVNDFNTVDGESTFESNYTEVDYQKRKALRQSRRSSSRSQSRGTKSPKSPNHDSEAYSFCHIAQNSSNHNSEWDRTPSIDSMNLLNGYISPMTTLKHKIKIEEKSSCCSESLLDCSACTHSVSTTTHTSCCSAGQTESSISVLQGRNEHCQHLRFYCGPGHDLFDQVVEDGPCIKLGPFRGDYPGKENESQSELFEQDSKRMSVEETGNSCYMSLSDNIDSVNPYEERKKQLGIEEPTAQAYTKCLMIDPLFSGEKESKVQSMLVEITKTDNDKGLVYQNYQEEIKVNPKAPHNICISQDSETNHVNTPPSHEQRHSRSRSILEKAMFYDGVMRGDLKSFKCSLRSSPTRQHTIAVGEALRSASQLKSDAARKPCHRDDQAMKSVTEARVDAEDGLLWTPLTTPEYSNTSSNITHLVPSSSSALLEMCKSIKLNDADFSLCGKDIVAETAKLIECSTSVPSQRTMISNDEAKHKERRSLCPDIEEESISSTGDVGENTKKDKVTACDAENSDKTVNDPEDDSQILDLSINLGNMKLNSEAEKTAHKVTEPSKVMNDALSTESALPNAEQTLKRFEQPSSDMERNKGTLGPFLSGLDERERVFGLEEEGATRQKSVQDDPEQENFTIPEKYFSALRSCMQLSNSQETFATLRLDTNDMELMAFLSRALKKKLVAAGLVGLSCNEIDSLLKSCSKSTESKDEVHATDELGEAAEIFQKARAEDEIEKMEDKVDTHIPPETKSNDLRSKQNMNNENNAKVVDVSELSIFDAKMDERWKHDPGLSSQSNSPFTEAKGKFYKTIFSELPCANKSNTNSSNKDAGSELAVIRKLLQTNMHTDGSNTHELSDTYLRKDSSDEDQVLHDELSSTEKPSCVSKTVECFKERTANTYKFSSPKHYLQYSEKQSCTFQKQPAISPVNRTAQRSSLKGKARGFSQGRISPTKKESKQGKTNTKLDSVRVISRSCSPKSQITYQGRKELDRTSLPGDVNQHFLHSSSPFRMPVASPCPGEIAVGETDHSRTESFMSATSRDNICPDRCSESDSGVDAGFYREKPMVEIFRDQDEYLRKLKEVRENFERSIQALSAERKSRQAAEERERGLARK